MLEAMQHDKKIVAGTLHFVLPTAIGATTIVDDVTEKEMKARAEDGRVREVERRLARGRIPCSFAMQRLVAHLQNLGGARRGCPPASFSACSIFRRSTSASDAPRRLGQRARQIDLRPRARRRRRAGARRVAERQVQVTRRESCRPR